MGEMVQPEGKVEEVNILLVDDQPEGLLTLEAILGGLGQNLVRANSGREALLQILTRDFAVILLDVQMPLMDGYETAALIRERPASRDTPLIFLTASHTADVQTIRGYSVGAVDYLFKPLNADILRSKVAVFVELAKKSALIQKQATELSQRNEELTRAQVELDCFFTLSLDMFGIAGMDGYFKRLNPAFGTTLGYSTEEMLARPFLDFVHPDDRAATLAEMETLGHGQDTIDFENRYRCKDGSWKWLSWKTHPFPSEGLLYATARDITGRKQAEEQIAQLDTDLHVHAVELAEANKELESFSYSVSHDLRAPLRHVHGYVEMLARATDGQLSEQAQRYLTTITEATVEMGQLIDDLLAFSRMGRAEMRESRVRLDEVVQDTIRGLEMATTGRNIVWQTAPLPPVVGDPSLLKQVLANLIGNAVKYSRMRDRARIEIGCAGEEDGQVILFVRDNGVGFDMQYAHKLFGVFQRLHRTEEFEGTGVGLATVRRIVARHGGRVWAEGAVNEGATFYFTLKPSPSA